MLRHEKPDRVDIRGALRTTPRRFVTVLLTLILLIPVQNIDAAGQNVSGTTRLSNTLTYGTTAYSVDYLYPSQIETGTNLTIAVTLHVTALTGLVEYIAAYRIIVNVFIGAHHFLNGSLSSGVNSPHLYSGSSWGPNNVTIPLTADNTGLAKGESANATLSVTLQDSLWYGLPRFVTETEPAMQGQAGSVVIQNSVPSSNGSATGQGAGAGQTYLPYALLTSGAALMLLAVFLPRGPRSSQTNLK